MTPTTLGPGRTRLDSNDLRVIRIRQERGGNLTTRLLDRTLVVIFILLLLHSAYAMTTGWNHTILDQYGFRQAQTAITIEYLVKGGPWFAYETPVLGPPWSIPFEFPLYQWIVALIVSLSHLPIDQAGRSVSVFFFYSSLLPLYFMLRTLGLSTSQRLTFLILIVASPLYIFWSRTVMIESCVLFLSLLYLALTAEYLASPRPSVAVLILLTGSLSAMVKLPTFFGFAICSAFFLIVDMRRGAILDRASIQTRLLFVGCAGIIPGVAGLGWSLYAQTQRALNPLGGFLALNALTEFTYGTARQRFSPELWRVIWMRSIPDILGSNVLLLPLLISLPLVRKSQRTHAMLSLAVFMIVWMTFTNLHFAHSYYQYANGVFLIAALGFSIAGLIGLEGVARKSGLLFLGMTVVLSLNEYHTTYEKSQESDNTSLQEAAKAIRENSNPDDVLIAYGLDWSPELLYSSDRRGIMVRDERGPESPQLRKAVANLGHRKIGALAVCLSARTDRALIARSTCSYGLDATPKYEDAICAIYLPSARARISASCAEQPPAIASSPPLANVEEPKAGSEVARSIAVSGWALSNTGIHEIVIYLDERLAGTTSLGIARPDVQRAYPQYQDSLNAGFRGTIELTSVGAGPHTLRVELQANDGTRHELASIPVIIIR